MSIHIVDTTLRDGEQSAGIALNSKDKLQIAMLLDEIGVYQIEAGIPAMSGEEKKSIRRMVEYGLKAKIAVWNRMNLQDIQHSIDCYPDLIHISVPTSDIQMQLKLKKDRQSIKEQMKRCIDYALESGKEVTIGFEDASRADLVFLTELCGIAAAEGIKRIRYADTVGLMRPKRVYEEVKHIIDHAWVDIEFHAHNDFGMAVSNSIAAVEAGAQFVDCTFGGIGERAGNCNFYQFAKALEYEENEMSFNTGEFGEYEKKILGIIYKSANKNAM